MLDRWSCWRPPILLQERHNGPPSVRLPHLDLLTSVSSPLAKAVCRRWAASKLQILLCTDWRQANKDGNRRQGAGVNPHSSGNDGTATNPRGIPNAPFVDRVEDYVATREEVEPTLRSFQEMISKTSPRFSRLQPDQVGRRPSLTSIHCRKYQFMEMNLQRRMAGLKDKIPEIQKTLDTVRFLKLRKSLSESDVEAMQDETEPIETTFELNETLYSRANVPATSEVYIWLGANVMLSYTTDEAETLLSSKLATAKTSLSHCEEDLDFLREQITTMEVATARVYNWEVVQKRKDKSGEEVTKGQSGEKTGPSKN
ncbi:putative prefoldin subunit 3 [Metarhizium anisopliae]|nr:putative prefoldin subunit 3 [Metarhizium anisopliae]